MDSFKGHKLHHIESARVALNNFRFATDVEKDIFTLKDFISNLKKAQGSILVVLTSSVFFVRVCEMKRERKLIWHLIMHA